LDDRREAKFSLSLVLDDSDFVHIFNDGWKYGRNRIEELVGWTDCENEFKPYVDAAFCTRREYLIRLQAHFMRFAMLLVQNPINPLNGSLISRFVQLLAKTRYHASLTESTVEPY
jgi:hypothetical protein